MRIVIPDIVDRSLDRHLRQGGEQLAFVGTVVVRDGLRAVDLLKAGPDLLDGADARHVAFSDAGRQAVLRWAAEREVGLAEVHTHPGWTPAQFSEFDLSGLRQWAPNVLWRLGGRPYAALVVAGSSIDGLVWTERDAVPVGPAVVERSGRSLLPTGRSALQYHLDARR